MKKAAIASVVIMAFGAGMAHAADLPVKAPPPVYAPPPFSWTGFYLGGNIGVGWAQSDWNDSFFGLNWSRSSDAKFMAGGQLGYNYQFNSFVIGAEADFDWFGSNGNTRTVVGPFGDVLQLTSNDTSIATLAARFGFASDRVFYYGKAGGGWVGNNGFTLADLTTGDVFNGSGRTASGWLVGAGIEYAFTNNWTVKLEYDFLGLPDRSFTLPGVVFPVLAGDTITGTHNVQMVKLGVNYLFNWNRY
jgi:outer membrane immunogenic protein